MMRSTLLTILLTCSLLAGCQSARFSPALPQISEYGAVRPRPARPPQLPAKLTDEPILFAAVSGPNLGNGMGQQNDASLLAVSARFPPRPVSLLATPDTALNRLLLPPPKLPADPLTTVVNIGGGITAAVGLGTMAVSNFADRTNTSWGGLGQVVGILTGLASLGVGIAFLFFQGRKGRMRLQREAREMNTTPEALLATRNETDKASNKLLGKKLLIGAGVAFLVGLLSGVFFWGIAVLLLLAGITLLIVGS